MSPVTQDKLVNYLMDRSDKFGNYINELAKQLGVAATHVYGVLVRQQYVEALSALITDAVYVAILILLCVIFSKMWKRALRAKDNGDSAFAMSFISFFFTAGMIVAIIFLLADIKNSLTRLLNPEYYALKDIMNFIQSKVSK
jgi:chromate transport protein ChrA